jgi:WD40 repeat protein
VAFDPATKTLISGGADGQTRLWNIDPDRVAALICATAGSPVTPEEWSRYVPGEPYRPPC